MPKVSVIVPIYKVEPYLRRCVDSILMQTFMDFELILVDDGSPDNCGAICDEYAQKDSRVHVIHQANGGLSAARNAGIDWVFAHSDSRWLTFVDSDDWIHPLMLEKLYHAVLEHNVKVSICGYEATGGDIHWTNADAVQARLWPVERFYVECNVNATVAWGKLYHRDCFAEIRYPVGKIHEDEYVTYRILFAYEHVAVIDMPMYAYFLNPEGIIRSEWTVKRLDGLRAFDEQIIFLKKNRFMNAYEIKAKRFIEYLLYQYQIVSMNTDGRVKIKNQLRIKAYIVKTLIRDRATHPFNDQNIWLYEKCFPVKMCLYWYGKAILRKLKWK